MFYTDSIKIITVDVDRVKRAGGYIWFCCKCLKVEIYIRNSRVRNLLDFGVELNLIKESTA